MALRPFQSASFPSTVEFPFPSPSATSCQSVYYDVYINHHGVDVNKTFASFLFRSLRRKGLRAFLDLEEFDMQDSLSDKIQQAILSSSVHIVIFSKNYAHSPRCLNELVFMLKTKARIHPVYYHVEPAEVRFCIEGSYADAFTKYEVQGRYSEKEIGDWKKALWEASEIDGWDLHAFNHDEGKLLEKIVNRVFREVKPKQIAKYAVGLYEAVEDFETRIAEIAHERKKNAKLVAIVGMSGSGNTTLAKQLFHLKSSAYDASCFLFHVHKTSAINQLPTLQRKLLKDLLQLDHKIDSTNQGKEILRSCFAAVGTNSRFLVILDDVDHNDQVDALLVENLLGTDSLLVITSRDRHLFESQPETILYEMKRLNENHARELFCSHAFHRRRPVRGFEDLAECFLRACAGLPLWLIVFGKLFSVIFESYVWESEPHKLSRSGLQKEIEGFCIGYTGNTAIQILWNALRWNGEEGIQTLEYTYRSFNEVEHGQTLPLRMHDLLRYLARYVVAADLNVPRRLRNLLDTNPSLKVFRGHFGEIFEQKEWDLEQRNLPEVPNKEMKHKLQIGYDVLDRDERTVVLSEDAQDAFLDICAYFGGWEWETVASIVGEKELLTLAERDLVTRVFDEVKVRDTAVEISANVSKGLRIKTTEDLSSVLEQEQDVAEIKGIWLMDNKVRFELAAEKLDQMHRSLRVLALGDWTVIKGTCKNRFQSLRFLQAGNVPYLPFNIANLDQLRLLQNGCGQEMGFSAAENIPPTLRKLELCQRHNCAGLVLTPQVVINLQNLRSLGLKEFVGQFMLPEEFQLLSQLTRLDLTGCSVLKLPKGLGQLNALEHMNLSWCVGLKELPESIGQLQSLRTLNLQFCTKLSHIPESFGLLKLLRILKLKGCRSLQKLPPCLGGLSCLEDLNLSGCANLRLLPSTFFLLSSLRTLNLKKCQSLLDLPHNIGNFPLISFKLQKCSSLRKLPRSMGLLTSLQQRSLSLNGCSVLKELPEEFCQLKFITSLDLSCCTTLEGIPHQFMELVNLRYLKLEKCENIVELPEGFGSLSSLEELYLNSCPKLKELCGDLECLSSLEKLILSNCENLEGEWMDTIVKIRSLKLLDITESWKLTERWIEIGWEENESDLIVKFYQADGDAEEEMIRKAASMFFSDECLLLDAYGCEIRPSTLAPNTTLVVVVNRHLSKDLWKQLVEKIKALQNNSLDLRIIHYIPNLSYSENQEYLLEPKGTTLSLSFKSNAVLWVFQRILSAVVGSSNLHGDYVVTTTVEADNKGIKHFSRWRNISGLLKQIHCKSENCLHIKKQLDRSPQESNLELLRALLVTHGRDFLLHKHTEQVEVDVLRGLKLVLLLISRIEIDEMEISILKEIYTKMRNNRYEFEVVWMPIVNLDDDATWGSYVRSASSMPWLAVDDPWSMAPGVIELVKQDWNFGHDSSCILVAVDEKGTINNKDAMGMVWRWGVEAYPFAGDAWDDLVETEWEQLKKKSSLEFLVQNLDNSSTVVKEAMLHGQMVWLYGGDPLDIPVFTHALHSGLRELDVCNIQILYIGGPSFPSSIELMNTQETIFHENNLQSISWPSLSFPDALRFWRRVECLWWELRDKGGHEMFKRLRKLLVSLLSLNNISHCQPEATVWMVAMDENGEMVTARGREVINTLANPPIHSLKELETREELIEASKRGELKQAIKRRFQDGVMASQHHSHHLLPFQLGHYPWPGVICDVCDKEIMAALSFFKCTICEDFNVCEACLHR